MLYLNLLPKKQRKTIRAHYYLRWALLISIVIFLALTALTLALALSNRFNKVPLNNDTGPAKGISQELTALEKEFTSFKAQLEFISALPQNKYFNALNKTNELKPYPIDIISISADVSKNILRIRGHSADRVMFLNFKDKLETEFPAIQSPLSNLVEAKDFDFVLSIELP